MKQLYLNYKLKTLINSANVCFYSSKAKFVNDAQSGPLNYEEDFHKFHIKTTNFQKILLALGSGFMSITDPRRGDMVAVMGESTGGLALEYIRSKMLESEEGRKILQEKPRISTSSVDLIRLKELPEGTLGKAYSNFLEKYKYSPDDRLNVRFVDDIELAYVATRYREAHDLFHTILDMPTNMLGEVTVKWVEAIQTRLPMCITGALFGPLRLAPKFTRTYATRASLDSDVTEFVQKGKDIKQAVWKTYGKFVELPKNIEENIIAVLNNNKALGQYRSSTLFAEKLYRRTLPFEGILRYKLEKQFKEKQEKILNRKGINIEDVSDEFKLKMKEYSKSLAEIKFDLKFNKQIGLMYLMGRAAYEYAALVQTFTEISRKDPDFKPATVLDFGSGVGTVAWAAKTLWGSSIVEYMGIEVCDDMINIAHNILEPSDKVTPLFKNIVYKRYLPAVRLDFDIVISSHSFFDVGKYAQRMETITKLWNLTMNYLVIVENGTTHGFQIIREVREMILKASQNANVRCHVVGPCPHDKDCPMTFGKNCTFFSKYKELNVHNKNNYFKVPYTYIIFKKENRNKNEYNWPRIVGNLLLAKRMVRCEACNVDGNLCDFVVSKGKYDAATYKLFRNILTRGDQIPGKIITDQHWKNEDSTEQEFEEDEQPETDNGASTENETVENVQTNQDEISVSKSN